MNDVTHRAFARTAAEPLAATSLARSSADALELRRIARGRGFVYVDERGVRIRTARVIRRIRALAIPPAYTEVRIAARANSHLQAVGLDAAGRLQYRYHPDWERVREARKSDRLANLCAALPRIRSMVALDLRRPAPDRRKALAAAIALIDRTHIRVGGAGYVHTGHSRGAATLLQRQVRCDGDRIAIDFRGKGRRRVQCVIRWPALARALRDLAALPGRRLFQYLDENGKRRRLSAADINARLAEIGGVAISAKDFRTLAATALAGELLAKLAPAETARVRVRQVNGAMRAIAERLGNTPAVVRRSYVHRDLIDAFEAGALRRRRRRIPRLSRGESLVAALFPAAGHD